MIDPGGGNSVRARNLCRAQRQQNRVDFGNFLASKAQMPWVEN